MHVTACPSNTLSAPALPISKPSQKPSKARPLLKRAKAAAKQIGAVPVDVGDTECKIPLATADIEKAESSGRLGKKRKTIRC
jgi:hypothetical protein